VRAAAGRPQTNGAEGSVWFRAAVGRKQNADPKWLIPLICRAGGVTKAEIGAIRIFDRETKFEIAAGAAEAFLNAVNGAANAEIRLEPTTPPGAAPLRDPGPRPAKLKPRRPERAPNAKPNEQERRRKNKAKSRTAM
jgi:ATP-dependent RNA helicase DeaD